MDTFFKNLSEEITCEMDFSRYFDWAATTPPDVNIIQDALKKACLCYQNPSSVHAGGKSAKALLEEARARCAKALNVKAETLIFTSGGTESDQWPLFSLLTRPVADANKRGHIVMSGIEHPAIREQVFMMKQLGFNVSTVNPEKNGIISAQKLLSKIQNDTLLVAVMAVNNETGCVQPVYAIADGLKEISKNQRKALFLVDCVQTIGKIPFCIDYPGIDFATISAHKLRGPHGMGLLYSAKRHEPFIRGGAQENGMRPGTENLFGALSLASCLEKYALTTKTPAQNALPANAQICTVQNCTNASSAQTPTKFDAWARYNAQILYTKDFIQKLLTLNGVEIIPRERINLPQENFSPWIVQAQFKNIPGEVMVRALSEKGFSISTGSACSAKKLSRPVLEAMGITKTDAQNAVRFSFGYETTKENIDALLDAIREIRAQFK